jgi:hypothetical protein
MKRKSKNQINELEKYKWEFLRRNKGYRKTYESYIKYKKLKKYRAGDEESIFQFTSDWLLHWPLDPAKSYETNMKLRPSGKKDAFMSFPLTMDSDFSCGMDVPLISGEFMIDIQFNRRKIVEKFKEYLDKFKEDYNNSIKEKASLPEKQRRARIEEYKRYLKVYDLRKIGWGEERIAKKFHSGDSERDIDYAKKKVRRDFTRCLKLIKGDYGQIT